MKVVLSQDVKHIGRKGEVKEVKAGFARNYLLPNSLAVPIESSKADQILNEKRSNLIKLNDESEKIKKIIADNQGLTFNFSVRASDSGKVFGSITTKEIKDLASKMLGLKITSIEPDNSIKQVGDHKVKLSFSTGDHLEVTVQISATGK